MLDLKNTCSKKIGGLAFLFLNLFLIFPVFGETPVTNAGNALVPGVVFVDKQEVIEKYTAFSKTFANPDGSTVFWQNGDMKR
jgi:hypothetical protein